MHRTRLLRTPILALISLALATVGTAQERKLSVDGGRPLYQAIAQLHNLNGWLISYEDPPFEHPGDLEATAPTAPPGPPTTRTHISPRHMKMEITYQESKTGAIEEQRKIVDDIVAQAVAAGAGNFRVYHNGQFSHLVPVSVRKVSGEMEKVTSICDVKVSLPQATRTLWDSVGLILSEVSHTSNIPVTLGMFPTNLFLQRRYQTEAQDENACDVLDRVLEDPNVHRNEIGAPLIHLAWVMLYDVAGKTYYFSVVQPTPQAPPSMVLGNPRIAR